MFLPLLRLAAQERARDGPDPRCDIALFGTTKGIFDLVEGAIAWFVTAIAMVVLLLLL